MGTVCEMAWNQGVDLYGYDDSRFLKGAEYVAKWSLGGDVPFTPYSRRKGAPGVWSGTETVTRAADADPAMVRPIWAMIANHYTKRRGRPAPYITRIAAKAAPEGGGGDYGPNSGGYDQLGFGTMCFTRDRTSTPAPSSSPSASASAASSSAAPSSARPQGGRGDLAATGSGDLVGVAAAGGVAALAGGLLLLRRRGRAGGEAS